MQGDVPKYRLVEVHSKGQVRHHVTAQQGSRIMQCGNPGLQTISFRRTRKNVKLMRNSHKQTQEATNGQSQPKITHVFSRTIIILKIWIADNKYFLGPCSAGELAEYNTN